MKTMHIARQNDLDGINRIRKKVRDDDEDPHKIKDFEVEDVLEKEYQITIVSKDQNNITGFLTLQKYYTNDPHDVAIIELFVDHQYRNKGIGESLIKFVIKYCQDNIKYNEIVLSILNDNIAIRLYKKCGFVVIKEDNDGKWMSLKL
ncbi:MAG: GNAT family N-acetyltransferase [Candidatus Electrothrix sp. LOE2]|nr:GNAT family N-acetyltransferase [Candidatus Electrothrix sp. LOE2]